jgi:hypothetical protein
MKYAVDMGSGAMIYVPSFIKIGSGIQQLIGGEDSQTHTHIQHGDHISLLSFFQHKECRLIKTAEALRFKRVSKRGTYSAIPKEAVLIIHMARVQNIYRESRLLASRDRRP